MSIEHSHGKARPTLPRLRDAAAAASGSRAEPSRDELGRVTDSQAARELAQGRGWKHAIAKMAGRELEGEANQLGRASHRLYRALLRDLPHDGPQVRVLVAAQARSAVLAARYAERALELGIETDQGRELLELSTKLDARAERLGVSALGVADGMAKADRTRRKRALDVHGEVSRAFSKPRTTAAAAPAPAPVAPGATEGCTCLDDPQCGPCSYCRSRSAPAPKPEANAQ